MKTVINLVEEVQRRKISGDGNGTEEQLRGGACDKDTLGRDERLKLIGLLYINSSWYVSELITERWMCIPAWSALRSPLLILHHHHRHH